jgi:hypothetical protein
VDQICKDLDDLVGTFSIKTGSGFVSQHHTWVVDQ